MTNSKILLIEDEPGSTENLMAIMPSIPYEHFTDTQKAYTVLVENQDAYRMIVLGQHMAKHIGAEFIAKINKIDTLRIIPIVLHGHQDDFAVIDKLIQHGARYYISTEMSKKTAQKILLTAIEDFERYHRATLSLQDGIVTACALMEAEFCIRTLSEAQALANFLAETTPNPRTSVVGFAEIFINAIEHGNLGITYEEKSHLHGQDGWLEEVNRRLNLKENKNKVVQIFFKKSNKHIKLRVIDAGQGFDWQPYQDLDKTRALDNHGRGIMMAKNLTFDSLEYIGKGNEVECIINLPSD